MKSQSFISVVVYVHNDEYRINNFLTHINNVLKRVFSHYEIICVNDASEDESTNNIKEFAKSIEEVSVSIINMGNFHGVEGCINAGVDMSIGDFVFEFDSADTNIDFEYIEKIYNRSLEGYDIVCAVPSNKKSNSKFFYWIYNKFSGNNYKISIESFRVLSRRAINRVYSMSNHILYRKALYASCGLAIDNMVFPYKNTDALNLKTEIRKENYNTAIDALLLFTKIGYYTSLTLCIFMALFTLGTGIYTVIIYFGHNKPVEGWAPIMGFMSAGFFCVFIIFTIVIKYLDLLLKLVFKRQKYLVKSIEKL